MANNLYDYSRELDNIIGKCYIDLTDKEAIARNHVAYMLDRTQSMFKYGKLPETIPQTVAEKFLQAGGFLIAADIDDKGLCVYQAALGGYADIYRRPTTVIISNPVLSKSYTLKIGEDCVLIKNDSYAMGLLPLYKKYASLLTENELTMRIADINARITQIFNATDDKIAESAKAYLKQIEEGKIGVICDNSNGFIDGIKTLPYSTAGQSNTITQLIELEQYLRASYINDIGLQANYNMKRESINSNEAQLNNDYLLPFCDDMLYNRKIGWEAVNKMFGTDITVELNSSWELNHDEAEAAADIEESEGNENEN